MAQLTATRTPTTAQTLAATLRAIWSSVVGGAPTDDAITTLVTQSALETGDWASMWNWNVGNIAGTGGDYVQLKAYTGVYRPYRAYPDLTSGTTAYLQLLHSRYAAALASAMDGDLDGFASNLKAQGYYEEDEGVYLSALQSRYASIAKQLGMPETPTVQSFGSSPARTMLYALAGGLALGGAAFWASENRAVFQRIRRRVFA